MNLASLGRCDFQIVKGKHAGKKPLVRPRRRWEDDIRMELKEIGRMRC